MPPRHRQLFTRCQLVGKIIVKPVDVPPSGTPIYSTAIAEMAASFEAQLAAAKAKGLLVLDARTR